MVPTLILPGDFDGDNMLTATVIDALSAVVRAPNGSPDFDLDQNGTVDRHDRHVWVNEWRWHPCWSRPVNSMRRTTPHPLRADECSH
jgi:hypothetical protein